MSKQDDDIKKLQSAVLEIELGLAQILYANHGVVCKKIVVESGLSGLCETAEGKYKFSVDRESSTLSEA